MWDLVAQLAPGRVQSPGEWRYPGKSALDQHNLQRRKLLKDALADQTDHLGLKRGGHSGVVFDVHRWPADPSDGMAALAAKMDADRQVMSNCRGVHRPVFAAAHGLAGSNAQHHLHKARMIAASLDLGGCQVRRFVGHDQAAAQPWL